MPSDELPEVGSVWEDWAGRKRTVVRTYGDAVVYIETGGRERIMFAYEWNRWQGHATRIEEAPSE